MSPESYSQLYSVSPPRGSLSFRTSKELSIFRRNALHSEMVRFLETFFLKDNIGKPCPFPHVIHKE